jgi:hypothetical protein
MSNKLVKIKYYGKTYLVNEKAALVKDPQVNMQAFIKKLSQEQADKIFGGKELKVASKRFLSAFK